MRQQQAAVGTVVDLTEIEHAYAVERSVREVDAVPVLV
jgi:hypothetical protein